MVRTLARYSYSHSEHRSITDQQHRHQRDEEGPRLAYDDVEHLQSRPILDIPGGVLEPMTVEMVRQLCIREVAFHLKLPMPSAAWCGL